MKKKVKVTVVYPVTFETEIDTSENLYRLKERVCEEADRIYESSSIDAVIHRCDEFPELVD